MSIRGIACIWLLILFSLPAAAVTFNDMNDGFVSNVTQLPDYEESKLIPDTTATVTGYLAGWVDIIGFTETAKINGQYYFNGNPVAHAVVRGNLWQADYHFPNGMIDSITKDITVHSNAYTVFAKMTGEIKWHETYCDKDGCWTVNYQRTEYFYDSEPIPSVPGRISQPELIVRNYTYPNKTVLETRLDSGITSFTVTNRNGSLTRHIQLGRVDYTVKGLPYANFTKAIPIWKHAGTGIYQQGSDIVLENDNFTFSARTPFGAVETEPNITRIQMEPVSVTPFNLLFGILLSGGYLLLRIVSRI